MTVDPAGSTLSQEVGIARRRLSAAGIPPGEADLDARLLAQAALDWDPMRYFRELNEPAPEGFQAAYAPLIERRETRQPIAYILGRRDFWDLSFEVGPSVLIPRPETEVIIETVLARMPDLSAPLRVADVGTGSGCLAIVLATQFRQARVTATDISRDALIVARRNAARHRVEDRVAFVACDLLAAVSTTFDLVVANPPYVPENERLNLEPEVRDHEPGNALFASGDGTSVIEALVRQAAAHLEPGGLLIFELGAGQAPAVTSLLSAAPGLTLLTIEPDLQGIPRAAIVQRVGA